MLVSATLKRQLPFSIPLLRRSCSLVFRGEARRVIAKAENNTIEFRREKARQ